MCAELLHSSDFLQKVQTSGLQTLYIVRHCKAEGQEAEAHLTSEGYHQAQQLSLWLGKYTIDYMMSSPYVRAIQTVKPYAEIMNKTIVVDDRLSERILSKDNRSDWLQCLERTFQEPDLCFSGGESSRQATERIVAVIKELLLLGHASNLVVAHSNIISLLLKYFDDRIGFEHWKQLSNPDVYRMVFQDGQFKEMKRIWKDY